jgi:phage terminase Nu1 subunit (DNA packaging protein)
VQAIKRFDGGRQLKTAPSVTQEAWVDKRTVAAYFGGVHVRTVEKWVSEGMPSLLVGGKRLFRISECEKWHRDRESRLATTRRSNGR